jgi:DNA-3-methyladenine glycosylase
VPGVIRGPRDSPLTIRGWQETALCGQSWYSLAVRKLDRSFYDRDTVLVARDLLGKHLVHHSNGIRRVGKIVEVEAYLGPHDLAAHSSKGLTPRTKTMFGPPGHAYVYFIYGMYYCMNVVTEREGHASAVLLRAVEPVLNLEGRTQGPGLLCKAFQIDKQLNGQDLVGDVLYIAAPDKPEPFVTMKGPRIGVNYARHWAKRHLRFYIKGNPFVSRHLGGEAVNVMKRGSGAAG